MMKLPHKLAEMTRRSGRTTRRWTGPVCALKLWSTERISGHNAPSTKLIDASTWAMLLIGFAGIAFVSFRRSPKFAVRANLGES
jgi:hypothetical protein